MSSFSWESLPGAAGTTSEFDADVVVVDHGDIVDFNPENLLSISDKDQALIHDWLRPTQYQDDGSELEAHLSWHLPGTGDWIFDSNVYREWHDSDSHGILWIRGIPGSGKSVVASTLVRQLKEENYPVLYFFFRQPLDTNNNTEALLRDFLAQILKHSPVLQHELSGRDTNKPVMQALPSSELWRCLHRALMYVPKAYCVVDAMDEMDPATLEALLKSLDALGRWRPAEIKLAVTSRPVPQVEKTFSRGVKTLDIRLDKKRVQSDISYYIQHRLSQSDLPVESHPRVEELVLQKADGLFLYAKLALDSFISQRASIPSKIEDIPADLTDMYTGLLKQHSLQASDASMDLLKFVLQLVTHATRPLRLIEIMDIARVVQSGSELRITKDLIRSLCGPLLEILPDETVRIVHHSLTEYLTGKITAQDKESRVFPVFSFEATHHILGIACLSYLAAGCLEHVDYKPRYKHSGEMRYVEPAVLIADKVLPPFTRYAGSNWALHLQKARTAESELTLVNELLDSILIDENLDKIDVLAETRISFQPTPLHFAIRFELQGFAKYLLSNKKPTYVKNGRLDDSLILYATAQGSEFMVRLLLNNGANHSPHCSRGLTPLHWAAKDGYVKVASILMDAGADPDAHLGPDKDGGWGQRAERPRTPLEQAFGHGSYEMAVIFSRRLQSPQTVAKALHSAVYKQNRTTTKVILQHPKLDINADVRGSQNAYLFAACLKNDVDMVELLLESGAMVNPPCPNPDKAKVVDFRVVPIVEEDEWNINDIRFYKDSSEARIIDNVRYDGLMHAWVNGSDRRKSTTGTTDGLKNDEVARGIRLLLAHGVNVDQFNQRGETALLSASDAATVHALLEGGADPNAVNLRGETLLHRTQDKSIQEILIPRANLNLQTYFTKRTPLHLALVDSRGKEAVRCEKALRLIQGGADITAVDKYGNSALHLAVGIGEVAESGIPLIEMLCSSGDVHLRNYQGRTPVHMNAIKGKRTNIKRSYQGSGPVPVLQTLLDFGADINARDNQGQTLLFQYAEGGNSHRQYKNGSLPVFEAIVRAGAEINVLDSNGRSLLHSHVHNPDCEISLLKHLVEIGIDPTHADHHGNTLLHEAMPKLALGYPRFQAWSIVTELIEMGVDPRRPNHLGRTPLHILATINPTKDSKLSGTKDICGIDLYLRKFPDLTDCADHDGVRPLHIASTFSEEMTLRFLERGASPIKATKEGLTPFHIAARSRQANIIGILLDKVQDTLTAAEVIAVLDAKDRLNRTALYYAAASGRIESFQLLVDAGATISHDRYSGSPWEGCANFEEEQTCWPVEDAYEELMRNSEYDHENELIKVHAGGVMISDNNRPKPFEDRRLRLLFPGERLNEIVDILAQVMSEREISFLDRAIVYAAGKGHDYTAECLSHVRTRQNDYNENNIDENVRACLSRRQAARLAFEPPYTRDSIIALMKSRDYNVVLANLVPEVCFENHGNRLDLAAQFALGGFAKLASIAASAEASFKTESLQGDRWWMAYRTPLLISACVAPAPNMAVVKALAETNTVDLNERVSSNQDLGSTALHCLAKSNHWWCVAQAIPYLIQNGADPNLTGDTEKYTPLVYALGSLDKSHFCKRKVQTLLSLGANPNGAGPGGDSCLSMTIDHPEIFELLIQQGAVATRSTLAKAIFRSDLSLARKILSNGADPNEMHADRPLDRDPYYPSDLYLINQVTEASRETKEEVQMDYERLKLLLEHGADPSAPYKTYTALHRAVDRVPLSTGASCKLSLLELLLDHPGVDLDTRNEHGMTLLLVAAKRGGATVVPVMEKLLAGGADVYARDVHGWSAMHYACQHKQGVSATHYAGHYHQPREFVLRRAPDLMDAPDHAGKTPLHHLLDQTYVDVDAARALLAAGADATHRDRTGTTPLHRMLARSSWEVHRDGAVGGAGRRLFESLVAHGADVNARAHDGETPIFAYLRGHSGGPSVDMSDVGPFPDAETDPEGQQAWLAERSRRRHHGEIVLWDFWEERGMDLHAVNASGETLLHVCPSMGTLSQFKILLGKGLDPQQEDTEHRSPIDVAAAVGNEDVLALFKQDE